MSPEIHAALIGGVITGLVVLAGVLLEHRFEGRHRRQWRLEGLTNELSTTLMVGLMYHSTLAPEEQLTIGSPGWTAWQRVQSVLFEADAITRRGRVRRHKAVREALEELLARTAAAYLRAQIRNEPLTPAEMTSIGSADLTEAVFGSRETLDERIEELLEHGFT